MITNELEHRIEDLEAAIKYKNSDLEIMKTNNEKKVKELVINHDREKTMYINSYEDQLRV